MRRYGLEPGSFDLLARIGSADAGVTAHALGTEFRVAASRIGQMFERLRVDSLVSLGRGTPGGDRLARITPAGVETCGVIARAVLRTEPEFPTALDPETRGSLEHLAQT